MKRPPISPKRRTDIKTANPDFDQITADDLRDDGRLAALYVEAVRRGFWTNSHGAALEFACFAEKALADDAQGTPGRLFYALVKRKDGARVTNAHEDRALRRFPSALREELVARATAAGLPAKRPVPDEAEAALFGVDGDRRIGYQHSVMMMCFLPQKRTDRRVHTTRHGRAALRVEAGTLANPRAVGDIRECPLPHGSRARLIIPYINAYAIRHATRDVDLGRSLRNFLNSLGLSVDGRRGKTVTEQLEAIAAAQFTLYEWRKNKTSTKYGRVSDAVTFWLERDSNQALLWEPSMTLSEGYYDALQDRRAPVDLGHLLKLTHSPRRMDLYSWLSYRTAIIGRGQPVWIRLDDLRQVFAPEIDESNRKLFRQRLRQDLRAIAAVYPGFRVRIEGDALVLDRSPPPVPGPEYARKG